MPVYQWSVVATFAMGIAIVIARDWQPWKQSSLEATYPNEDNTRLCLKPNETAEASFELDALFPDGSLEWDLDFVEGLNGMTKGGNGGCDGVFGKLCADGFIEALRKQLSAYRSVSFTNLSCPEPVLGAAFHQTKRIAFEMEADEESFIQHSGNASWAYTTYPHANTLEEERNKTAFTIVVQYPCIEELDNWNEAPREERFTQDDFGIQLACIMHHKTNKGQDLGSKESSSDDSLSTGQNESE
ncbi:hypothetical protein EDB81DRAFT_755224 [Dactylonectria macrodidyma]|uniref:Uncharacterized protein n=1 Tax=Dactylonectria macrodidyma TaxID=307937 RepID=A0A9P9JKV2_9HYPO|nr:hypothetical protein EDB81DRAFT_755224 [Dactylonectria macrodidyma]